MKKQVMNLAWELIKNDTFQTLSKALKAAWKIIKVKLGKPQIIEFAKKDTAEVRTANVLAFGSFKTLEKGYLRFVEMLADGTTQWRSFQVSRMVF